MHSSAVIRLVNGRLAWYAPGADEEPCWLDDEQARESLFAAVAQQRLAPCFAVPGADVRLLQLSFSAEEKKHITKSLPFMLEEHVAVDIEQLHFAHVALDKLEMAVAVCGIEQMEAWQAQLEELPGIRLWLPEPLLLPWRDGEWCIVLEEDTAIVRYARCGGFTIERELLPAMLANLEGQAETQAVIFYGREQAADIALLPQELQDKAQWRRGNLQSALLLGEPPDPALNLLQGAFAVRLPVARWWREWRVVAAVFAAAFVLQLVATYTDYLKLDRENLALRGAIEKSYRRAFPRGAVVDAETQLRRQLASMRGSGEVSSFVHLVEQVGAVIASNKGSMIDTINYNFSARGGEMRMNIVANDFEAVERVRADINKAGLEAVMESSSAQGDKVRARLRVGGQVLKEWFAGLEQREQLSVVVLVFVLGLYLLYMVAWAPLADRREQLVSQNRNVAESLQRVDAMVSEIMSLRDAGGASASQRNLTAVVNQSTGRRGLQVSRLQPNSRGDIQVRLENAVFDELLAWLDEVENREGLLVTEVAITQSGSVGRVNATIRIAQG